MEEDAKKWWEERFDLEGRTKKEVEQWLQHFKQENDLDFHVDDVACRGKLLADTTEAQLMDIAGKIAGIEIFNAKETLKKKGEKRKSTSECERESDRKVRLSEEAPEMELKRALKEFLEQTPKLFREHLGETMDTKEKEEMISSPVKYLGKVEAMLVMKHCTYDLVRQGLLVVHLCWLPRSSSHLQGIFGCVALRALFACAAPGAADAPYIAHAMDMHNAHGHALGLRCPQ
uniref:Uncharacterized protein n=1 Tax=Lotharella oceanica TaxID=641309 RepID=A0A7S2U223_9EUKA|eukprot:CAMPEP_0170172082 /NCGR_PEP_ID=MMETSP0040_2-20121228/5312_1 /TAXON_ID=641309 /ORGANISM="Lotharella oceanica, Strain CCMP622" /LENGTH=230 /DNA_ID=CAMNT_0010412553 /DNA_START=42 /DNA_END=734 /DNA_ORIENTATION=-